ncbi:MAG: branched-chain amino acid ABC transporter ATP-binding protein/permease, partial [Acidiferrobacterales bacterium]
FYFAEFSPLAHWTGGENGLPGVPSPVIDIGFIKLHFDTGWSFYPFMAFFYFLGIVIALRIVRSPVGVILRAIRENPLRAAAVGHSVQSYKLAAFVIAAAYAGMAGGLLGVMQGFMPPDAFTFDTSGQLVIQTAIGGRATLFGPLVGATVWLYLRDFLQATLGLGATWKLVLGVVFVLLVVFLQQGIVGGIKDLYQFVRRGETKAEPKEAAPVSGLTAAEEQKAAEAEVEREPVPEPLPGHYHPRDAFKGPILQTTGISKRYGGIVANEDINFSVNEGEVLGIIGPNGAGKSTFFKMLTCEVHPSAGKIEFEGRDITGMSVADVCQLGLTKSYQVNQLFEQLTVRENLTIAALGERRGKFKLDMLSNLMGVHGLEGQVRHTLDLVHLAARADVPVSDLAYGEKRRLEVGLALATSPSLLLLDEPLAGMSPRERVETVALLKSISKGRTMVIIDHDMESLFELAERITVLNQGRVLVEGTPDEIKGNAEVQEAYLGGVHGVVDA